MMSASSSSSEHERLPSTASGESEVDVNESQSSTPVPLELPPPSRRYRMSIAFAAALAVVAVISFSVLTFNFFKRTAETEESFRDRAQQDYPGWEQGSFNTDSWKTPYGTTETHYEIEVKPPNRDFEITVIYYSYEGEPAVILDHVLRPRSLHSYKAESLLDYIEEHYVDKELQVSTVRSDIDGTVVVNYTVPEHGGEPSGRELLSIGVDKLLYNSDCDEWELVIEEGNF